jgi:hypothetical protein
VSKNIFLLLFFPTQPTLSKYFLFSISVIDLFLEFPSYSQYFSSDASSRVSTHVFLHRKFVLYFSLLLQLDRQYFSQQFAQHFERSKSFFSFLLSLYPDALQLEKEFKIGHDQESTRTRPKRRRFKLILNVVRSTLNNCIEKCSHNCKSFSLSLGTLGSSLGTNQHTVGAARE